MLEKYIGGSFASTDHDDFISSVDLGQYDQFFPEKLNSLTRHEFETGTDALAAIISEIKTKYSSKVDVWFPKHYCYDSVSRLELKTSINTVHFYDDIASVNSTEDCINVMIFMHFNGYDGSLFTQNYGDNVIVIEDFVYAPLEMRKFKGNYAFNSLRKITDKLVSVAYLDFDLGSKQNKSVFYETQKKASLIKAQFIETRDSKLEEEFLELFTEAENSLSVKEIVKANSTELYQLRFLDLNAILERRKLNYSILHKELEGCENIQLLNGEYLFVMARCKNRDNLRKHLFQNNISAPIHWSDCNTELSREIICFPIDQRYVEKDMLRLANLVTSFFK